MTVREQAYGVQSGKGSFNGMLDGKTSPPSNWRNKPPCLQEIGKLKMYDLRSLT